MTPAVSIVWGEHEAVIIRAMEHGRERTHVLTPAEAEQLAQQLLQAVEQLRQIQGASER